MKPEAVTVLPSISSLIKACFPVHEVLSHASILIHQPLVNSLSFSFGWKNESDDSAAITVRREDIITLGTRID